MGSRSDVFLPGFAGRGMDILAHVYVDGVVESLAS